MFGAGLATHFRDGLAEALPEDTDHDVTLFNRHVFVNGPLRAFIVNARTGVGLPAQHSEYHIAFARRVAVEGLGDVADVLPLNCNIPWGSDEYRDDPYH